MAVVLSMFLLTPTDTENVDVDAELVAAAAPAPPPPLLALLCCNSLTLITELVVIVCNADLESTTQEQS